MELAAWLRLVHTPGLGPRRIARLVRQFGSPGAAVQAGPKAWAELRLYPKDPAVPADQDPETGIARDLEWLAQDSAHQILTWGDPAYPPLLAELPDPPAVLYLVGDAKLLKQPQIAIIGSRDATGQGLAHAERFARELSQAGLVITSGLARGIDGAAHRGALSAASGLTVAIVATGPDRVYPSQHRRLAHRIKDSGGLLVSLWPVGTAAQANYFPQRNRVISGLALGVLVVEAALRSGSLITARLAAEQGRTVYALPGSVLSPVSRGCHRLIQEGAQLVETPDDVLEDLARWLGVPEALPMPEPNGQDLPGLDPEHAKLLATMGFDPVDLETLIERTGLTVEILSSMLVIMELNGRVATLSHGRYQRLDAGPALT